MAKKYQKYLPKAGSAVAVAMAMTVALSTQAQAAELDQPDQNPGGNLPVDEIILKDDAAEAKIEPVGVNNEIGAENAETAVENQESADDNAEIQQENKEAAENNEQSSDGALENPELNLPDAPDLPDTDGMGAEDYNEVIGDYNDQVDDYNEAAEDYNNQVDDYNSKADDYDQQKQEQYEEALETFEQEEADHQTAADAYAAYEQKLLEHQAEVERLTTEYNQKLEAFKKAESDHQAAADAYAAYEQALLAHQAEVERLTQAHEALMTAYNERAQEHADMLAQYNAYLAAQTQYNAAVTEYNKKLELYNDNFEAYLQQYVEDNGENDAEYQKYLEAKAAYEAELAVFNAYAKEQGIFEEVSGYNQQIEQKNENIDEKNAELEDGLHAGTAEHLGETDAVNDGVQVREDVLNVLGSYDDLLVQRSQLQSEAAVLEAHAGKDAALGSAAYAAYLQAVEAYNEKVASFNADVEAYNVAVEVYNAAVDTYNANKPADSSNSSTSENQSTATADWGNFKNKALSFNHLDVRYHAAAVMDQIEDTNTGEVRYSDSVSKYDVVGVYFDQEAAEEDADSFGINYTNTRGQNVEYDMVKDDEHDEFCTASTNHRGEIDRTDASANKNTVVTFYATLDDGSGQLQGISIRLDANSVYAEKSYYKYDPADHLHEYKDSDGNHLKTVTIDGEKYYDISGQSVFLISALACDGYEYRLGGLDLILNMQTIIEIYQAENAEKISYIGFEKGKTAQIEAPDPVEDPGEFTNPMPEPKEPDPLTPVADPGEFTEQAPELDLPDAPPPVTDPGAFTQKAPELDLPDAPNPVTNPGTFDKTAPTAPTPTERLNHVELLNKLEAKVIIEIEDPPVNPPVDPVDPPVNPVDPPVDPEEPPAEPAALDDEIDIPDEEVPLAEAPKTGDISALWAAFSGLSAAGYFILGKKRKGEDAER